MRSLNFLALSAAFLIGRPARPKRSGPRRPGAKAAVQLGGEYEGRRYVGGHWITVDYGRPILRGRSGIFGAGDSYGKAANAGAPVWRAGANQSTRFMTEADLMFGDKLLPAGEYSMFVDLKEDNWTLIFSTHAAKTASGLRAKGLGRLRVHRRQGCLARQDGCRQLARVLRAIHHRIHEHDQDERQALV